MNKQETIQHLTNLMATIQAAYFKGRKTGVRVHEESNGLHSSSINIDLYDFEGAGGDLVEGLHGVTPDHTAHGVDTKESGWVFNIGYDPDDEEPLCFLFLPDGSEEGHYTILPDSLPADLLQRIADWLEKAMQPAEKEPEKIMVLYEVDEEDNTKTAVVAMEENCWKNRTTKTLRKVLHSYYDDRYADDNDLTDYDEQIALASLALVTGYEAEFLGDSLFWDSLDMVA